MDTGGTLLLLPRQLSGILAVSTVALVSSAVSSLTDWQLTADNSNNANTQ